MREGYHLNLPERTVPGSAVVEPLVAVDQEGVVVSAVKLADDRSGDVVVRLYESHGRRVRATLTPGFALGGAVVTDLLERPLPDDGSHEVAGLGCGCRCGRSRSSPCGWRCGATDSAAPQEGPRGHRRSEGTGDALGLCAGDAPGLCAREVRAQLPSSPVSGARDSRSVPRVISATPTSSGRTHQPVRMCSA